MARDRIRLTAFPFFLTFLLIPFIARADSKEPTVAVIGAGLAGLTTAYRLHQNGFNVHVFEARNRVGGRVLSVKIDNRISELGGENIADGGEAENIRRLIEELDLELTEFKRPIYPNYRIYFDGSALITVHPITKFDPVNLREHLDSAAQKATNMQEILDDLLKDDPILYKFFSVGLASYEGGPIDQLSPIYKETLYHMLLGGICSVHQATDANSSVQVSVVKGGNALLTEKLASSLASRIHCNMPLTKVSQSFDRFYHLTFQNGQEFKADILVLAIPCSLYEDLQIDPNLIPKEKLEAIQNVQYGTNAKILIPISQIPMRRSVRNDRMICFVDANSTALVLYYAGKAARFTKESILETYRQDRPMLEKALGDLCPPPLPITYARDESFLSYEGSVGYSWPNDPYVKGTYSFIASGQETLLTQTQCELGETVKTLFAPIGQTLYFAGEHTSILFDAPGTMEAACESGERTARMIQKSLE